MMLGQPPGPTHWLAACLRVEPKTLTSNLTPNANRVTCQVMSAAFTLTAHNFLTAHFLSLPACYCVVAGEDGNPEDAWGHFMDKLSAWSDKMVSHTACSAAVRQARVRWEQPYSHFCAGDLHCAGRCAALLTLL